MIEHIAQEIEKKHNVTIDRTADMYTTGDPTDNYGWMPIPREWVSEQNERV